MTKEPWEEGRAFLQFVLSIRKMTISDLAQRMWPDKATDAHSLTKLESRVRSNFFYKRVKLPADIVNYGNELRLSSEVLSLDAITELGGAIKSGGITPKQLEYSMPGGGADEPLTYGQLEVWIDELSLDHRDSGAELIAQSFRTWTSLSIPAATEIKTTVADLFRSIDMLTGLEQTPIIKVIHHALVDQVRKATLDQSLYRDPNDSRKQQQSAQLLNQLCQSYSIDDIESFIAVVANEIESVATQKGWRQL